LKPPDAAKENVKPTLPDPRYVRVTATEVEPSGGKLKLHVALTLPVGYKINEMGPTQYWIEAIEGTGLIEPAALDRPTKVAPPSADFEIALPLAAEQGAETLKISFIYYYCEAGDSGVCKIGSVVWMAPVRLVEGAKSQAVELKHRAN
jgi:hypothetical protein